MVLESGKSNDYSCNIGTKVKKFDIVWSIQNFSQRPEKTGQKITSQTCVIGSKDRSEWCLWVYPNGYNDESKEYVSLFLVLKNPDKAKSKIKFSILNDKGEEENVRHSRKINEFNRNAKNTAWGLCKFVKKDFLLDKSSGLLINDMLKILCEAEIIDFNNSDASINVTIPQSKLSLDLGNLFDSTLLYDCVIKVEDTEIKVHKAVLAARSPIFHDIFNGTSEKSQINIIEIKDFRVDVVRKMLEYIYKDEISDIQNMDNEMFEIANRYELHRLKAISEQSMCTSLTIENVLERFRLSEKYPTERLEKCCQEFILKNVEGLKKTKEWEKFIIAHPSLLKDHLCNVQEKFKKSNYECSIENLSQRPERTSERVESPTCVVGSHDEISVWCLHIYPHGTTESSEDFVSIYLTLLKPDRAKVKYYKLTILNTKEEEKNICVNKVVEFNNRGCWGSTRFIERDHLLNESNSLLVNNIM